MAGANSATTAGGSSTADFWRFWAASATSTAGDGVAKVALPLLAIGAVSASNFELGLLTAAGYAAIILIGLPAGVLVQRLPLRRLQVGMDVLRALLVASIPIAAWADVLTMPHLLAVAFLTGLASNMFDVANATFIPQVVPREELARRNGLLSGTYSTTQLAGPSLGGLLVQILGAAWGLMINAFSFIVSAVLLQRIPEVPRTTTPADENRPSFRQQLAEGLLYVGRHPVMRPATLAATAANFSNGVLMAVMVPFLVRELGLPAGAVGLLIAADGVGSIIGATVVSRLIARWGDSRVLRWVSAVAPVLSLLMPMAFGPASVAAFVVGLAGFGASTTVLSVIARTHRQLESPPELLARVMASVRFVSWSAIPVGALLGGTVAEVFDPRAALLLAVAGTVAMCLAIWCSPIRSARSLAAIGPRRPESAEGPVR